MNNVVLIGRLVLDPVIRYTNEHKAVANFTLAINRRFDRDKADFIKIIVWGKQAENVANYLKKGSQCAVNGWIQTGNYTDKDGKKVYTTDVVASEVEFLSYGDKAEAKPTAPAEERDDLGVFNDEDIPF